MYIHVPVNLVGCLIYPSLYLTEGFQNKQIHNRHPNNYYNNYWYDIAEQLCRVRTLRRGLPASTKTWIDIAQDRELWRQIVYQRF